MQPLVDAGVDELHYSRPRFWRAEFREIDGSERLKFAGWAKKLTAAATISFGSVGLSGGVMAAFSGEGSTSVGLDLLLERMERDELALSLLAAHSLLILPGREGRWGNWAELKGFDLPHLLNSCELSLSFYCGGLTRFGRHKCPFRRCDG